MRPSGNGMGTVCGEENKLDKKNMFAGSCWIFPTSVCITTGSKALPTCRWEELTHFCPLHHFHGLQGQNQGSVTSNFLNSKSFFLVSEYFVDLTIPDILLSPDCRGRRRQNRYNNFKNDLKVLFYQ